MPPISSFPKYFRCQVFNRFVVANDKLLPSKSFKPIYVFGPTLAVIVIPMMLFFLIRYYRRRRKRSEPLPPHDSSDCIKEIEKALEPEVEIRQRQEENTEYGELVCFSRYVFNGSLRHLALITHGQKFEFRLEEYRYFVGPPVVSYSAQKIKYITSVDSVKEEKRRLAVSKIGNSDVDGYHMCLIGWTRLLQEQVNGYAGEANSEFGRPHLKWYDCQHFLEDFSMKILVEEKAADYRWFFKNIKTDYRQGQDLLQPPLEMIAYNRILLLSIVNAPGNDLSHVKHIDIRNKINLNGQTVQKMLAPPVAQQGAQQSEHQGVLANVVMGPMSSNPC